MIFLLLRCSDQLSQDANFVLFILENFHFLVIANVESLIVCYKRKWFSFHCLNVLLDLFSETLWGFREDCWRGPKWPEGFVGIGRMMFEVARGGG